MSVFYCLLFFPSCFVSSPHFFFFCPLLSSVLSSPSLIFSSLTSLVYLHVPSLFRSYYLHSLILLSSSSHVLPLVGSRFLLQSKSSHSFDLAISLSLSTHTAPFSSSLHLNRFAVYAYMYEAHRPQPACVLEKQNNTDRRTIHNHTHYLFSLSFSLSFPRSFLSFSLPRQYSCPRVLVAFSLFVALLCRFKDRQRRAAAQEKGQMAQCSEVGLESMQEKPAQSSPTSLSNHIVVTSSSDDQ